jgi:hydrogenase-4 component B
VTDALALAPAGPAPAERTDGHPGPVPAVLSGLLTMSFGLLGFAVGVTAAFHPFTGVRIGWLLPLVGVRLALDPLGGLFMAVTAAVAVTVGLYVIGYGQREHLARFSLAVLPVFVAAMLLVTAAGSVTTFVFAWELMAVSSLLLVLSEHRHSRVREAGIYYAVLTQLGFAAILLGLMVFAAAAGADSFTDLAALAARVSPGTRTAVFLLTLVGFGSKAGLVPLHAWLPRAHPEAPSPVSALMSAAMVNLGIYGLIRFDLLLLGPAPRWWGLVLMTVGAVSALYGVLQASVATDLKRLLAYSTTENMGLIVLALGASTMLSSAGAPGPAAVALAAALLHTFGHAAFKALAFLAAGSVLAGTGLRNLDKMGGLARRMPATTSMFGVAAIGACGLPLGAGFVSEWLLLQALIHSPHAGHTLLALVMPIAVGVVALTTGLGVAAMVKAFGVGFLARPRSVGAATAREASATMLSGMGLAALACMVLATAPILVGPLLTRVLAQVRSGQGVGTVRLDAVLRLPGLAGSMSPGWLAVGLLVATLGAVALSQWGASHRPTSQTLPLWACGADELSPRMQYTATSFAEPLQRVFDDVLRPETDIEISHYVESRYLVQKVAYRAELADAIEDRLYTPVLRAVLVWAGWVRRAHSGSVHLYLAYGGVGLLVVLVLAR